MARLRKRLLAVLLLICVLTALVGCGGAEDTKYRQVYPADPTAETTASAPSETETVRRTEDPTASTAALTEPPAAAPAPETEAPTEAAETETPEPETAAPTETPEQTQAAAAEEPAQPDASGESGGDRSVEESAPTVTYVLNRNTKKFHKLTCSSVGDIKPENRWDFTGTRDEAIDMGYVPCKRCKP